MAGSIKSISSQRARKRRRGESQEAYDKRIAYLDEMRARKPYQRWAKHARKRERVLGPMNDQTLAAASFSELTKQLNKFDLSILSTNPQQEFELPGSSGHGSQFCPLEFDSAKSLDNSTSTYRFEPQSLSLQNGTQNLTIDHGSSVAGFRNSKVSENPQPNLHPGDNGKELRRDKAAEMTLAVLWTRHAKRRAVAETGAGEEIPSRFDIGNNRAALVALLDELGISFGARPTDSMEPSDPVLRRFCGLAEFVDEQSSATLTVGTFIEAMTAVFARGSIGVNRGSAREMATSARLIAVFEKVVDSAGDGDG